jgi:hypothetical protein
MPYIGVSPQFGVRRKHTYTATAGQTSFSGAGSEGATLSYTDSNFVDVYQNGVKLGDADYTSTSGTAIVLAQGASVDDLVEIIVFDAFSAADTVSKADGGTFDGNVTMGGTLAVTGNGTVGGTLGVTGNQTNSGSVTITGDLASSTSGTSNFRAGVSAGSLIGSGANYNTFVGDRAGRVCSSGDNNVAIGFEALDSEIGGGASVAVGYQGLLDQNTSSTNYNTAVGYQAGKSITSGIQNTLIGGLAGDALTDADYNVAIGKGALTACTQGSKTTAIGTACLESQNISSAADSLNTAVGFSAGYGLTSGKQNTLMGVNSGVGAITGNGNSCYGLESGNSITSGAYNTFIGRYTADSCTTGSYNTQLGNDTDVSASDVQFAVAIGHSAVDKGTNTCFITPTSGCYQGNNSSSWSTTSDKRIKKNITDNNTGLDAINKIKVKNFEYRTIDEIVDFDNPKAAVVNVEGTRVGIIAQEIREVLPDVVTEQSTGVLGVNPDNMTWYLVNAVKELSTKVTALETENTTQATQIADLISRVTALESK